MTKQRSAVTSLDALLPALRTGTGKAFKTAVQRALTHGATPAGWAELQRAILERAHELPMPNGQNSPEGVLCARLVSVAAQCSAPGVVAWLESLWPPAVSVMVHAYVADALLMFHPGTVSREWLQRVAAGDLAAPFTGQCAQVARQTLGQ